MKKQSKINNINNVISKVLSKLLNYDFTMFKILSNNQIITSKYARLMRLDKPMGFLLLMLPCLWAIGFAPISVLYKIGYSLFFALGAFVTRSAGCIINDIFDRHIDKKVDRTKNRPLASGEVSLKEAFVLLSVLLSIALLILLFLPKAAIYVGAISIIPIIIYPLLKRYTYYPQVFLGFVFNLGVIIAWITVYKSFSLSAILVYLSAVFWTIGYDTIYALQDKEDDLKAGVKSLAIKFGDNVSQLVWILYRISALSLFIMGLNTQMNWGFYILMAMATYHLYWQVETLEINNKDDSAKKFKSNLYFGILVLIAIWIGKIRF